MSGLPVIQEFDHEDPPPGGPVPTPAPATARGRRAAARVNRAEAPPALPPTGPGNQEDNSAQPEGDADQDEQHRADSEEQARLRREVNRTRGAYAAAIEQLRGTAVLIDTRINAERPMSKTDAEYFASTLDEQLVEALTCNEGYYAAVLDLDNFDSEEAEAAETAEYNRRAREVKLTHQQCMASLESYFESQVRVAPPPRTPFTSRVASPAPALQDQHQQNGRYGGAPRDAHHLQRPTAQRQHRGGQGSQPRGLQFGQGSALGAAPERNDEHANMQHNVLSLTTPARRDPYQGQTVNHQQVASTSRATRSLGSLDLSKQLTAALQFCKLRYSGKNDENSVEFFESLSTAADAAGIDEGQRWRLLPFALTSSALSHYKSLPEHVRTDLTLAQEHLESYFTPYSDYLSKVAAYFRRKQKAEETVQAYCEELLKLRKLLRVDAESEETTVYRFIDGLMDTRVRETVLMEYPKNLEEAAARARLAASTFGCDPRPRPPATDTDAAPRRPVLFTQSTGNVGSEISAEQAQAALDDYVVLAYSQPGPKPPLQCNRCSLHGHVARFCPAEISGAEMEKRRQAWLLSRAAGQGGTTSSRTCFNCGSTQHLAARCTQPKRLPTSAPVLFTSSPATVGTSSLENSTLDIVEGASGAVSMSYEERAAFGDPLCFVTVADEPGSVADAPLYTLPRE